MKRADSLLQTFVKELGIEEKVRLAGIKKHWRTLFNEPLSSHMSPCSLSEGELLINVDSPVWLQELNYHKGTIIEKLSPYGVREVRLRLGRVSSKIAASGKGQMAKGNPLTAEEHAYVEETVSGISDLELREKARKAMVKSIASRKIRNPKH